jgi:hypothetical protein
VADQKRKGDLLVTDPSGAIIMDIGTAYAHRVYAEKNICFMCNFRFSEIRWGKMADSG